VAPPRLNPDGTTAVVTVYPRSSPQSSETTRLVQHLRGDVLPPLAEAAGSSIYVGGQTAIAIDFSSVLSFILGGSAGDRASSGWVSRRPSCWTR
jgi:RND superfamily putative drug exporter